MEKYNVRFKKKFGQNFLKDKKIVNSIIKVAEINGRSLVIEVGPGGAILTSSLCEVADRVICYEIDNELEEELNEKLYNYNNYEIIFKDFLDADILSDISKYDYDKLYFVSNVPYYITTPIIIKLLRSNIKFDKIVMMVQKELGDRLSSVPGSKEYSSITALLNYSYDIRREFKVSRNEFIPIPNVDSVVISLTPKDRIYLKDFDKYEKLLRDSFQFKRKTIRNNLRGYDLEKVKKVLATYDYDLNVRAEELDYSIFVDIANSL